MKDSSLCVVALIWSLSKMFSLKMGDCLIAIVPLSEDPQCSQFKMIHPNSTEVYHKVPIPQPNAQLQIRSVYLIGRRRTATLFCSQSPTKQHTSGTRTRRNLEKTFSGNTDGIKAMSWECNFSELVRVFPEKAKRWFIEDELANLV